MERKKTAAPTGVRSHNNDRSRSPHREFHPWDSVGKPKSVLYPADVQYFRQSSRKGIQRNRLLFKPSSSKSSAGSSPLRQSQGNREKMNSDNYRSDPDASIQRTADRFHRWTKSHSPAKFMAGLMPKDKDDEAFTHNQATTKSRIREPWTVEYFLNKPQNLDKPLLKTVVDAKVGSKKKMRKKHHYKMTNKGKGKENCVIGSSALSEDGNDLEHNTVDGLPTDNFEHGQPDINGAMAVRKDSDGYAISSAEKPTSPLAQEFEISTFLTPETFTSPDDAFFTPMTHVRPLERSKNFISESYSSTLKLTSPLRSPKFSLIEMRESPMHPSFERNASIKGRIESQLEEFDRVSSKLDISIQNLHDVLSKPISFGLPSLDTSNMPSFSDSRQTIDVSQLGSRWRRNNDVDVRSRHSLPLSRSVFEETKWSTESYNQSLDGNAKTSPGHPSNTSFAVCGAIKKQQNIKTRPDDVSLAKALGSSMAAELAYADKIEETRKHLRATRQLKKTVTETMERIEMDKTDDFDEILNSISLHDGSLVTFDDEQAPNGSNSCSPVGLSVVTPGHANEQKVAAGFTSASEIDKHRVGRAELKGEVDSYIRMRTRFYNLQLALLKLKKRLVSAPTQVAKVKKLVAAANEDYESAIGQANSWLEYQVPQKELLRFIKIRQRKLCNETEECGNTIRRLLGLESLNARRDSKDAYSSTYVNTGLESVYRNSAVRIDTEALNKSVDCDMWNLSARSMRRNLEARREQAEILNKSFEEMSKDIEKRTKKSIAAQIVEYDRVIAERTDLITQLDKISSESNNEESLVPPEISTPRRVGVEPLDLDRLSPQTTLSDEERTNKPTLVASLVAAHEQPTNQEQAEEGSICRSHSHSTVYEDSVSHLGDDDENKSRSASSEGTLYEDSREKHIPSGFDKEFPSRRTLDTAEILTMLSRHVTTIATDDSLRDNVKQGVENIVEDVGPQKMAHTNEEMRFDSEGAVAEAKKIIVKTNDVANTCADDSVLLNDVLLDSETGPEEIFTKPIVDEKDGSGDASYIQENIALDVSLAQFHLSEIEGRLDITKRVSGSAVVVNPITVEEYTSTSLLADHIPTPNLQSEISHSESLLKGLFESDNDSYISSQGQLDRQNTAIVLDKTDIVAERAGGIDATDTATKHGENVGETTTLLSGFVSKEQILEEKVHGVEEFDRSEEKSTLVITAPKSEESNLVHSFVIEALDARTDIADDEQLAAVEKDDMLSVQNENSCNVAEKTAGVSSGNSEAFDLEEEPKRIKFHEYFWLQNEEEQGYLTSSNDVVIGLNHRMGTFTNVIEEANEEKRVNDNVPSDVLNVESVSKEVNTADENIEEKSEFNTSVLDPTAGTLSRLSFTRTELYDELSSSIRHLLETSSPRRSSLQLGRYRYELSESLLEDTKSSIPKSPPTPQERFMTKMPSSLSPRLGLLLEENLNTKVAEAIAQEEAMRLLTDDVVADIDEEIAQLELRRPLSKDDNRTVDSSEAQTELDDESYEDLLSIEKPSSIFDKLTSTSPTNVTPGNEVSQRRKLENLREKVDSSDWLKEKCFQFSKEVWKLVSSRGFMRAMLDEFIPVPELECDTLALDEKERLIVRNKNTLIWATVVELAAILWPESSAKRGQISSKWLPIPKSSREFAEMSERYVFEQLTGFQPSHRYMRLSRPWASDNSETMVDEAVACSLYGRDPNCVDFKRKVNAEYQYLTEELVRLAGDRFVSSAIQQVIDTSPSSSFGRLSGECGRPSLGGLLMNRLYDPQAPSPPHCRSE